MELRDLFACHAMSALIVSTKVNKENGQMTDNDYAVLAYVMADAMLRNRVVNGELDTQALAKDEVK